MFYYQTGLDFSQAFIALSRRVSAANAHFHNGNAIEGEKELAEAMKVIEQVEQAKVSPEDSMEGFYEFGKTKVGKM